jgi:DNA polymerase epsilon subunit 4
MENKNIEQEMNQENENKQSSKKEIKENNNEIDIKEVDDKFQLNNGISKNENDENIKYNINEEMALNKMDIDKEQNNNLEEEKANNKQEPKENNAPIQDINENQEQNDNQLSSQQINIEQEQNGNNLEDQKINNENESIQEENENKKEKLSTRFPLAKIKNIMKLDNDIKLCQKDVYSVLGKVTEMFLQELAQGAYAVCKSCKRKTINLEDINSAIKMDPKMGFINFNSIFYVQELNKMKKRAVSTKKIEKYLGNEKIEEKEQNINDNNIKSKEKKKRGKTNIKDKNKKAINNMTLDSMFGKKNN